MAIFQIRNSLSEIRLTPLSKWPPKFNAPAQVAADHSALADTFDVGHGD